MLNSVRIAIGTDHRGLDLKNYLVAQELFGAYSVSWLDVGTCSSERTDYPLFVPPVIDYLYSKQADFGILLCATGIGMSIAANRYKHIYAALVWNAEIARASREDDNSNILVFPADYITDQEAHSCITAWLSADFKHNRYAERLRLIDR